MCRNIKTLHNFEPPATDDEVRAAALQYVRKVSGSTKPSKANEAVFERAVDEIAHVTQHLLADLVTAASPRDREVEAARARARAEKRFGARRVTDLRRTGLSRSSASCRYTRQVRDSARFPLLALAAFAAVVPAALLHFVGRDKVLIDGWIHFGGVASGAGIATRGRRRADDRRRASA